MKRWVGLLLVVALMIGVPSVARADYDYASIPTPEMLVVDANDITKVFYERNADAKAYPASTTKIMTALLALEDGNLDDEFMVGQEIEGTTTKFTDASSLMGLKIGEMVTLRDLVYGLMLVSGNDAGEAIAKHVGGSVDGFVQLMNQKAQALGLASTHFTNPHGVHDDNHYTTARDLAKLTAYALQNKDFCQIVTTLSYTVPANNVRTEELVLNNSNELMRAATNSAVQTVYPYAIGVKTGNTPKAGKCLVAAAEKDGARVICVLLGDEADLYDGTNATALAARFLHAASIFEYVFDNEYQTVTAAELGLPSDFTAPVTNGRAEDLTDGMLPLKAQISDAVLRALPEAVASYKSAANAIAVELSFPAGDAPKAPVTAGEIVGSVNYVLNGKTILTAPLAAGATVIEVADVAPETAASQEGTDEPASEPTSTPLISTHKIPSSSKILLWVMIILIVLLIALVVVFVVTERKRRRREAARRRRAAARRNRY